ncbi:hypothetical protein C1646_748033 [Rhizophagus diaphanus]|nr:hypothetical protein C1646_748033 [Rhizophagus diaphanus] [Rhizophagus sp. MUCL 43196]
MVHKRSQNKLKERKDKSFSKNKRKREEVNKTIENKDKELQQQQQLINNLERVEVSQNKRIQYLERQNSRINNLERVEVSQDKRMQDLERLNLRIKARESEISQENTRNLKRALGAEGRIKELNFQILNSGGGLYITGNIKGTRTLGVVYFRYIDRETSLC